MLEELVDRAWGRAGIPPSTTADTTKKDPPDLELLIQDLGIDSYCACVRPICDLLLLVKLHIGSISTNEHEEILGSKLSLLEQQMYSECRDLMHALEERKNNEYLHLMRTQPASIQLFYPMRYTQAMGAVRLGVKRLEDTLEEERGLHRTLQSELTREKRESGAAKSMLAALQATHSDAELRLAQANQALSLLTSQLDKEKCKSLSLANNVRSTMAESLAVEQSTVSI